MTSRSSAATPGFPDDILPGQAIRPLALELVEAGVEVALLAFGERHGFWLLAQAFPDPLQQAETLVGGEPVQIDRWDRHGRSIAIEHSRLAPACPARDNRPVQRFLLCCRPVVWRGLGVPGVLEVGRLVCGSRWAESRAFGSGLPRPLPAGGAHAVSRGGSGRLLLSRREGRGRGLSRCSREARAAAGAAWGRRELRRDGTAQPRASARLGADDGRLDSPTYQ